MYFSVKSLKIWNFWIICVTISYTAFWFSSCSKRITILTFYATLAKKIDKSLPFCFDTAINKFHSTFYLLCHASSQNCTAQTERKLNWIDSNKISSLKLFVLLCFLHSCINISQNLLIRQKHIESNLCYRKAFCSFFVIDEIFHEALFHFGER